MPLELVPAEGSQGTVADKEEKPAAAPDSSRRIPSPAGMCSLKFRLCLAILTWFPGLEKDSLADQQGNSIMKFTTLVDLLH